MNYLQGIQLMYRNNGEEIMGKILIIKLKSNWYMFKNKSFFQSILNRVNE